MSWSCVDNNRGVFRKANLKMVHKLLGYKVFENPFHETHRRLLKTFVSLRTIFKGFQHLRMFVELCEIHPDMYTCDVNM